MKTIFNITTTPLGQASGLQKVETIIMENIHDNNCDVKEGTLTFVCGNSIVIYAAGTWATVTTSEEK